jgi:hypothetical protein
MPYHIFFTGGYAMTATRKSVKVTEENIGTKFTNAEIKRPADNLTDKERFDKARKALRDYWLTR